MQGKEIYNEKISNSMEKYFIYICNNLWAIDINFNMSNNSIQFDK